MSLLKKTKAINRRTISIQNVPDFIGQNAQYKLDRSNVIQGYNSDLATTFPVLQTHGSDLHNELYAIVPKIPQTLNLSKVLSLIKLEKVNNLAGIVDLGIGVIDGKEQLIGVFERPNSDDVIANKIHLFKSKPEIILQNIIMPLLGTLIQLHSNGITHGCINLDNIFIASNFELNPEGVVLSNTALDLSGYNQHFMFETINRMVVHRSGKSPSDKAADCYALGVILMALLSGEINPKTGYEAVLVSKVKIGSYKTVLNQWFNGTDDKIDPSVKAVAYWLLHDERERRWDAAQALKFLRRRHRKTTLLSVLKSIEEDFKRCERLSMKKPLIFSNEECFSRTEAAVSSIRNYDDIKLRAKNGKLINALLQNEDMPAKFISKVSLLRSVSSKINGRFSKEDLFLTLFITLLNNQMPIKISDLSVEPTGIWQMMHYTSARQMTQLSSTLQKLMTGDATGMIYKAMAEICDVKISSEDLEKAQNLTKRIGELKELNFSDGAIAFFATNYMQQDSSYSSELLNNRICFDNLDLMEMLDRVKEEDFECAINDERMLCFILGNLLRSNKAILKRIKSSIIDSSNDSFVRALLIFSLMQNEYTDKPLKSLARSFYNKLSQDYLKNIRHLALRNKIDLQLKDASDKGSISLMVLILQSKEIDRKQESYFKVLQKVEELKTKVSHYKDEMHNVDKLDAIARNTTVRVAGSIFLCTICIIFYNLFWLK